MEDDIESIISNYYKKTVQLNLQMLNITNSDDLKTILTFFSGKYKNQNFDEYDKTLKLTLSSVIDIIDNKEYLIKKIDLFLSNRVFIFIDKGDFIPPYQLIKTDNLPITLLKSFFIKILHHTIILICETMLNNIVFYTDFFKKKNISVALSYNILQELKKKLHNIYFIFVNFYVSLLNKYDQDFNYILPLIDHTDNMFFSLITKDSDNFKNLNNQIQYHVKDNNSSLVDVVEEHFSNYQELEQSNEHGGFEERKDDIILNITNKLSNMSNNHSIRNIYTKDEFKRLETLLENTKINDLIKKQEIKLNNNFQNLIKNILDENEEKTQETTREYFNELFRFNNATPDSLSKEELYNIYKDEPDKKGFLKYLIDKIIYSSIPSEVDKKNSTAPPTAELVSIIDRLFNKINDIDYRNNSLDLQNDDIKFILMLETLNSIKTGYNNSLAKGNITVNLFKDVAKTKINNEEVVFN